MAALAPSAHVNLHLLRAILEASDTEEVPYIRVGDSRSTWGTSKMPGEIFRQLNVKHAALICDMVGSNQGTRDGLGALQITLTGVSNSAAIPGATLTSCGIVNTLPVPIMENWITGTPSFPHFSRYVDITSTAGGAMDATAADDTGGTFKRGDPAQSRNIASIQRFAVTDNRAASAWLPSRTQFGYSGAFNTHGPTIFSAPPSSGTANLLITAETMTHGTTTGVQIGLQHRFVDGSGVAGQGFVHCATRINFAGAQGIVLGVSGQGSWSITDHLSSADGNTDSKYTDAGLNEWIEKVMQVSGKRVVLEIDLGQNSSTVPGFEEWDGITDGLYGSNMTALVARYTSACLAKGATSVLPVLHSPWQSAADADRINAYRATLAALATANGWVFYDKEAELRAGGYSDGGADGLNATYRADPYHQNFAGMNLFGQLFNNAVFAAEAPSTSSGSASRSGRRTRAFARRLRR